MTGTASSADECIACAAGKFGAGNGNSECKECTSVFLFQDQLAQTSCKQCPMDAVAIPNFTRCHCDPKFYAIPITEPALFETLDPEGHTQYLLTRGGSGTELDINQYLGFWCVPCPKGADCAVAGTTLLSVKSLPGYYLGVDGVGSHFYQCLSSACLGNGTCDEGYVGQSCTECEAGLVLGSDFECFECPPIETMLLVVVAGLLGFVLYMLRKIKSKKKGVAPKAHSVFIKIFISALQQNA